MSAQLKAVNAALPDNLVTNLEHYLGYTLEALRDHLEAKLQKTYGISLLESFVQCYHLDHIYPLSQYNVTSATCEEFKTCWRIENLQMIPAEENLTKSDQILEGASDGRN